VSRTKQAEERLEALDKEMQEAERKMQNAISDYADKRVAWAIGAIQLSRALDEDGEEQKNCCCRSAPMGSTFCATCKHDLGCPVHNAAPCRRTT